MEYIGVFFLLAAVLMIPTVEASRRPGPRPLLRPSATTICDFYTREIWGNNTARNQKLLMTVLVNTFVTGNYTTPNTGVTVAGIATPAVYNGTTVDLLPYFTGALNSTNLGGDHGASKPFLDNGAAAPLAANMPSNGDVNSAQYKLLTHIYQYFRTLTGCSLQGGSSFPRYSGRASMYEVHRFMDLDIFQMSFFIRQVHDSALSLGLSSADAAWLANTLDTLFNRHCAPATRIEGISAPPEFQAVCIAENCLNYSPATCGLYPRDGVALVPVNATHSNDPSSESSTQGGRPPSSSTSVSATSNAPNSTFTGGAMPMVSSGHGGLMGWFIAGTLIIMATLA
ncbi:uncharacterized protein BDV14DRAFT_198168 [Aspergillus stella-maris]|uniref:uncharacterized protein n=1 Tax=Aspergillus stella-maris TaxID=1810926 RepID=UPI003CCC9CC7